MASLSSLVRLLRKRNAPLTLLVIDGTEVAQAKEYHVFPRRMLLGLLGGYLGLTLLLFAACMMTPLWGVFPGTETPEMRRNARVNALRISALEDSLALQEEYMEHLRRLMLGEVEPDPIASPTSAAQTDTDGYLLPDTWQPSPSWLDHEQPAVAIRRMEEMREASLRLPDTSLPVLPNVTLPALTPVDGFVTRGFDVRSGHFAIDIAVSEGTAIHSIWEGYIVLSDWTQEGGFTVAIQHSDGYLSIYKHNQRLYKRVGDRVQARDVIALSGNSGEFTTGPHLHFELWHNGLAQDPSAYLIGP